MSYANSSVLVGHIVAALVERRVKLGLSQEELDHKIGWSDRLLCKFESGTRTPSMQALTWWAEALGLKLMLGAEETLTARDYKKATALVHLSNGYGIRKVARMLEIAPSTLSAWRRAVQGRHKRKAA